MDRGESVIDGNGSEGDGLMITVPENQTQSVRSVVELLPSGGSAACESSEKALPVGSWTSRGSGMEISCLRLDVVLLLMP